MSPHLEFIADRPLVLFFGNKSRSTALSYKKKKHSYTKLIVSLAVSAHLVLIDPLLVLRWSKCNATKLIPPNFVYCQPCCFSAPDHRRFPELNPIFSETGIYIVGVDDNTICKQINHDIYETHSAPTKSGLQHSTGTLDSAMLDYIYAHHHMAHHSDQLIHKLLLNIK